MKDWLKKWFFNRWHYKLAAFMTAFILWFYVVSEQNLSINLAIPLEFLNYPADSQIVNRIRTSVDITIEGRRDIITKMDKRGLKASVDIKMAKLGKNNYIISAAQVMNVPKGVIITSISPASIVLEFAPVQKPAEIQHDEPAKKPASVTDAAKAKN